MQKTNFITRAFIAIAITLLGTHPLLAADFTVDGIAYNITSTTELTCEVTSQSTYTGDIKIPGKVTFNETEYTVTTIGGSAFHSCGSLSSVILPNTITTIDNYAFYNCTNLARINIPNSVTSIGYDAFWACSNLTDVYITDLAAWCNVEFQYGSSSPLRAGANLYLNDVLLTDLVIPNTITSIKPYTFYKCKSINTLSIPSSVISIEDQAFYGCNQIKDITIATGLTKIGTYAFYNCKSIKTLSIPSSVTEIANYAFNGCTGITDLTIEDGSETLSLGYHTDNGSSTQGYGLFASCPIVRLYIGRDLSYYNYAYKRYGYSPFCGITELQQVTIGNNVTEIDDYLFYQCTGLNSLTIGTGVLSIGYLAAQPAKTIWLGNTPPSSYTNITSKINYVSNEQYTSFTNPTIYPYLSSTFVVDGVKYAITSPSDRTCEAFDCIYDTDATNINIGETVSYKGISLTVDYVKPYTCYRNTYIENIDIENDGNIGEYAFYQCTNAKGTTLKINNIGNYAFSECTGIVSADITANDIWDYAFYLSSTGNTATYNITAETIGVSAFEGCSAIESATINATSIGEKSFYNCSSMKTATLGETMTTIGTSSFHFCSSLEGITIPNSVTELGEQSFSGCTTLGYATIGSGLTTINRYTFSDCSSLPEINIPQNITTISHYAFSGCKSLAYFTITDSENELQLGSNGTNPMFKDCPLNTVYIGRNITYNTTSGSGYSPFYNNTSLEKVTINDNEIDITEREFYGCTNLKTISLGNNIGTIGAYSFYNCSNLEGITIPDAVTILGEYSFYGCSTLGYANIGKGVPAINNYTFKGCSSLSSITIPKNITTINDYVFSGCSSLAYVTIDDRETELALGSNGSNPMFYSCPLNTVYIGGNISYDTTSSGGYSPFYRNTSLETVIITDIETEISENEFYGCTGLKNVTMGDGVESIGNWAFSGCSSLDYFSFGTGMKTIGDEAFSDCTAMTQLISNAATPPTCGTQALDDISKWDCTLTVPDASISSYQSADQWKEFFFIVTGIEDTLIDNSDSNPANVEYYNLHGVKVENPEKGIYIKKQNGRTSKIII